MQTPIQNSENFNFDDFITFSERVKKSTQKTVDKMENKINQKFGTLDNKMDTLESNFNLKMDILEK